MSSQISAQYMDMAISVAMSELDRLCRTKVGRCDPDCRGCPFDAGVDENLQNHIDERGVNTLANKGFNEESWDA